MSSSGQARSGPSGAAGVRGAQQQAREQQQRKPEQQQQQQKAEEQQQQLATRAKDFADPKDDCKGDASWMAPFFGSPSSLRLALHVFAERSGGGHSVMDCRLFGRNKVETCKWNGWGYCDTYVSMSSASMIRLHGSRYSLCGVDMGHWHEFMESIPGIEFAFSSPAQDTLVIPPQRVYNEAFIKELQQLAPEIEVANSEKERLFHGHGHTCNEIFELRYGTVARLPDVVLYPKEHKDVEAIVECASRHNVCLIPFGGGTSVTLGVAVPVSESRMVATVSLAFMQRILFLDKDALLMWVEAGAVGASLEERLRRHGVTLGHEPDSMEFSTVGGWVATRASGMKKNRYGNIEDMVVDVVVVTSKGSLNQQQSAPRVSSGPSLQQLMLGSEGTLGIITQVLLKVKLLPEPASIRLMDKTQTQCGSLFRVSPPGGPPLKELLADRLKKFYLNKIKGWKEEDLCGCTLVFEGTTEEVNTQRSNIYKAAKLYGALPAGSSNGERGYQMTFLIAYLRDFIMEHHWIVESFEASMAWPVVLVCYQRVKDRIKSDCSRLGIKYPPLVMVRLTQVYDGGAVLYFYFGFNWAGLREPIKVFSEVEHNARQVILDCKGSISHHHGVGKLRKEFMAKAVGKTGMELLRATKGAVDPQNIFGNGNMI
ncbi:D-lactate dehydrogenase, related [Eimeria necatrix]|uniref:Alkylglycerone-phosphate synthase n=1 Tax=Eimeria necatrix TaxID=51315 RepID=U6N0N0_9EIME|nr:D-lactate dehydrogenase, related [Eimeria necatrix]CDJ69772.1 D-lactate dehydrogenase, related [Eimeria necatrix]